MRRGKPPRRHTPLRGGASPQRKTRIKPRNAKRRESEFARCYHSRARVRWVKDLGCLVCLAISPLFWHQTLGKCDNAHTETDGMGRKAGYDTIVPLCREHHRRYDERRHPCDLPEVRSYLESMAPKIEARWQEHSARSAAA